LAIPIQEKQVSFEGSSMDRVNSILCSILHTVLYTDSGAHFGEEECGDWGAGSYGVHLGHCRPGEVF